MAEPDKKSSKRRSDAAKSKKKKGPPGRIKLALAMRKLLETKEFYSITTDEIARTAGTNEALIYRYFGDKRGLLHRVLADYLEETHDQITSDLKGVKGSLKKLAIITRDTFDAYSRHKVFARIILVEARNFPGYFESDSYRLVKRYAQMLMDTIEEGVAAGEIKDDISPKIIRDTIIGAIEHIMLPSVLFGRDIDPDVFTRNLFSIVLKGIINQKDCHDESQAIIRELVSG